MADRTAEFFGAIAQRRHEPFLEKTSGTVRVDLTSGARTDHWLLSINKGDLSVSDQHAPADCVIRADKEIFDRIASGEANAQAMFLRGALEVQGSPELLLLFTRLFPSPPVQRDQPSSAGYARREA
jgi:predicted lipid carrier protein YhbT